MSRISGDRITFLVSSMGLMKALKRIVGNSLFPSITTLYKVRNTISFENTFYKRVIYHPPIYLKVYKFIQGLHEGEVHKIQYLEGSVYTTVKKSTTKEIKKKSQMCSVEIEALQSDWLKMRFFTNWWPSPL